jgi:hypothetical protein
MTNLADSKKLNLDPKLVILKTIKDTNMALTAQVS